jgi:hypothetical protein
MPFIILLCALLTASETVLAQAPTPLPAPLQAKVDTAAAACADFNNGQFAMEPGAVVRTDLDGDLQHDWVLNEFYFACSSAASLYGSTGGTLSHFLIGEHIASLLNQGWELRALGRQRVLIADVHGSQCDAVGYVPCVTASVWDSESSIWRSAAARWNE